MSLVPLSEAVAAARAEHAEEVAAVVAWSGALGRTVDPDVLALIHAARDADLFGRAGGGWDRYELYAFLWGDLFNWCSMHRCPVPDALPEALWLWLHHLDATGRLGPDDEPLHDLLKVLLCYGGLGFDGRPRPAQEGRLVACECYAGRRITSRGPC